MNGLIYLSVTMAHQENQKDNSINKKWNSKIKFKIKKLKKANDF